jgi:hypothetical protein
MQKNMKNCEEVLLPLARLRTSLNTKVVSFSKTRKGYNQAENTVNQLQAESESQEELLQSLMNGISTREGTQCTVYTIQLEEAKERFKEAQM